MKVKSLSRVRLFTTPWTAAHQAPPFMGVSRQKYWSGVPLPSPSLNSSLGLSIHPEDSPAVPLHLNSAHSTCQLCRFFLHSNLCWIRGPGCVFVCIKGSLFHSISTLLTSGSTLSSGTTHSGGFILKAFQGFPISVLK